MKDYESITRTRIPRRFWFVIRLDGKAFHTFTRGLQRPYDERIFTSMNQTALLLCNEADGVLFAYTQSDEISLVFGPGGLNSQPWFDGQVQKLVSVTASIATAGFNDAWFAAKPQDLTSLKSAYFDSRIFALPSVGEVANYLIWRQQDAIRNSVSMAAQSKFSHKQLQGVNSGKMQDMLFTEHGINWNDYPVRFKRGGQVARREVMEPAEFFHRKLNKEMTVDAVRHRWVIEPADHFTYDSLVEGFGS
jgi:tRNA(His) 5'-end guanylyltransferase